MFNKFSDNNFSIVSCYSDSRAFCRVKSIIDCWTSGVNDSMNVIKLADSNDMFNDFIFDLMYEII